MIPGGSVLGGGYTSIMIQVKNHIENVNCDTSFACHKPSRSSHTNKRGLTYTCDCTKFQPELSPEVTNETMEHHHQRLEKILK